jgi:hypothetical protein
MQNQTKREGRLEQIGPDRLKTAERHGSWFIFKHPYSIIEQLIGFAQLIAQTGEPRTENRKRRMKPDRPAVRKSRFSVFGSPFPGFFGPQ